MKIWLMLYIGTMAPSPYGTPIYDRYGKPSGIVVVASDELRARTLMFEHHGDDEYLDASKWNIVQIQTDDPEVILIAYESV